MARRASRPDTRKGPSRHRRRPWLWWTRRPIALFGEVGCGCRAAAVTQRPTRRSGQMLDATTAAAGATSARSALGPPPYAAGARRSTQRQTTGAPSRGAGSRRAPGVNTLWPSVQTARAPTLRSRMPARGRRRPAVTQRLEVPLPQVKAARRYLAARRATYHHRGRARG